MIQAKHCDLCEHPKRSLKNGLTCGLTDKKPTFTRFCPNIKFTNSFLAYLPEIVHQIKVFKSTKISVYLKVSIFTGIGVLILLGSYSLLKYTLQFKNGFTLKYYFELTFLVYTLGTLFLSLALWHLNIYSRKLKKLILEKARIEKILAEYGVDFETLIKNTQNWKT